MSADRPTLGHWHTTRPGDLNSSGAQTTHHYRGAIMGNRFTRLNIVLMSLDETRFGTDCLELLSPREREIALLVARGLTNKQVGHELSLSDGTVKQHIHSIFMKLASSDDMASA
jgi:DNA-binding NarL/FixJ family response regulator